MHPSQQLFRFVKSLDRNEVKYFRAFAKRKITEGSNALKLFELILAADEYNETQLSENVAVENFPALKVYLFTMLSDAIHERDLKRKGRNEIIKVRCQAEAFYRKRLWDSFWKRLDDAMALCVRYEEFRLHWEMMRWKQSILMEDATPGYIPEGMEDFDEVYPLIKERARNLEAYQEIADDLELARRTSPTAMLKAIEGLDGNPLLAPESVRLSKRAEILYRHVIRTIFWRTSRYAESMLHTNVADELLQKTPFLRLDDAFHEIYIVGIHVIGMFAAATGDLELAAVQVKRLKIEAEEVPQLFLWIELIQLRIAWYKMDIDAGLSTIGEISSAIQRLEFKVTDEKRMQSYFLVTHFLLFFSMPKQALDWVAAIRQLEKPGTKRDLYYFTEILHLVCHFDLGNFGLIADSDAAKVLRFLKRNGVLSIYEETVVKGLRKASRAATEKIRLQRLRRMVDQLTMLLSDDANLRKFNMFQFDFWLQAKIEKVSPASVMAKSKTRLLEIDDDNNNVPTTKFHPERQ